MTKALKITPGKTPAVNVLRVPGSKSFTNRALIAAGLAEGKSLLKAASFSDDVYALVKGLTALGIGIRKESGDLLVLGKGGAVRPKTCSIDVGHAGTAMRFLTAVLALTEGKKVSICGSPRMHRRPVGDLVGALNALGAGVEYLESEGTPPLKIRGILDRKGGRVSVSGEKSSQFISALLLIAPCFREGLKIDVSGALTSRSYVDMTLSVMNEFGVKVKNDSFRSFTVNPGQSYKPGEYLIEGDASGASYLWGAGALTGEAVAVKGIGAESVQGDARFPDLLSEMGCRVEATQDSIEVLGPKVLRGISVDMNLMPDTAQTLAVLGACARGTTVISGLSTLKKKETDRLKAVKTELAKTGIKSDITGDSITVCGGAPEFAEIDTYGDHRMAMAFSLLGLRGEGIVIKDPGVVSKSFPGYWESFKSLGVKIKEL